MRTLTGSMYHDSLPVLQVILSFNSELTNTHFLKVMVDLRDKWDKYRKNTQVLSQEDATVLSYTYPFPVRNRRISEKVYKYEESSSVRIFSHSVDLPIEVTDEEDGVVLFSLGDLRRHTGKTTVTFTSQVDLKLPPTKRSEELISKMGAEWAQLCFKALDSPI